MLDYILEILKANASEIGTALVTGLIALLKRWFDKTKIKKRMIEKGFEASVVKQIMNGIL